MAAVKELRNALACKPLSQLRLPRLHRWCNTADKQEHHGIMSQRMLPTCKNLTPALCTDSFGLILLSHNKVYELGKKQGKG